LRLLEDAYQRRDEVAVIAFRGAQAELILAPTRQVEMAQQALASLPTGGRTPLPQALRKAAELLSRTQAGKNLAPLLVLMSDGKANIGFQEGDDAWQQTLAMAEKVAGLAVPTLVLDTEAEFVRLGRAKMLAEALRAECLSLDELSVDALTLAIRQRLQ
jgi:magnesium chelatase subunit D